jgi:hypothetical protein
MASTPGGLTTSIRRQLREGKLPEEIVRELVAGGLGQVSAQRFVDRALAEDASSPAEGDAFDQVTQTEPAETASSNEHGRASTGRLQVSISSLLMSGGIAYTGFSYAMTEPGQHYTLAWGPVAVGFLMWCRAIFYGVRNVGNFAWFSAASAITLPILLLAGIFVLPRGMLAFAVDDGDKEPEVREATTIENFSTWLPGEGPSIPDALAHFDAAGHSAIQCDIARVLAGAPADRKAEVITGLMARYAEAKAKVCVRTVVNHLDPTVRFPDEPTGSR